MVTTLYGLIAALGVGMSEMFADPPVEPAEALSRTSPDNTATNAVRPAAQGVEPRGPVQRRDRRASIELEHGFRWERLTTGSEPGVEFIETIIAVGEGRPDSQMKTHSGREYGVVLDGAGRGLRGCDAGDAGGAHDQKRRGNRVV